MDPRIILERLVERLERKVGSVTDADFCAFEGREEGDLAEQAKSGNLHLAQALMTAKEALASGDDDKIMEAALICPSLERTGSGLPKRAGGRKGGERRRAGTETRDNKIREGAIKRLAKGMPISTIKSVLAQNHNLSTKQIGRIIKKTDT